MNASDRGKQRIFEARLTPPSLGEDFSVAICCMPLIAMSVARRIWPAEDDRMVLVTSEVESRWNKIYSPPEGITGWVPRFWWRFEESPKSASLFETIHGCTLSQWAADKLSEGEKAWFLSVGDEYGPLFGGGYTELWAWNGRQTRYICNAFVWNT